MALSPSSVAGIEPEAVQAIVAEVVRRILAETPPAPPQSPPPVVAAPAMPSPPAVMGSVALPGRVIALAMLEKLPAGTGRVVIDPAAVVTPSAREHARDKGIAIDRQAPTAPAAAARSPFVVACAECGEIGMTRAAAVARSVPVSTQLPASGVADVVAALAMHTSRDGARGILLAGRPALAAALANRSASLRAVTARDPAALAAAAAECNANLLVVDPAGFPAAALLRLAADLAARPSGETPAPLAARPAGCGCKGH